VRRARHQHLALVHHGDALREAEHAVDIVLDDQYRDVGGDAPDQVRDAFALRCREPGERFVEQQHVRPGTECDAEIDQPLPAIGELAALDGLDSFQAEEARELVRLGVNLRVAVDVAPDVEPPGMARLQRQPQVLVDRESAEQVGDLERAREPLLADLVRRNAADRPSVQAHAAAVRRVQS
jgi:hypothetical protein